ncbi:S1 RNA-binding domain-containing protein, partial [bacterium]|nr:S1 RNA-binding domain-containing protein [bacterium]
VTSVKEFGVFVECLPGKEGLLHVSEIADFRVENPEDICKVGDEVVVKCVGVDDNGKVRLSRKAVLCEAKGIPYEPTAPRPSRGGSSDRRPSFGDRRPSGGGFGGGDRRPSSGGFGGGDRRPSGGGFGGDRRPSGGGDRRPSGGGFGGDRRPSFGGDRRPSFGGDRRSNGGGEGHFSRDRS